ncbi:helix-turn-helix transcriptional regulator [Stenotrophomonas geniculata]|uniref:helix-turn-helix transcriptional regulator n=1 Tax=Stenotrophomonas geniculata TaxID=86188 RepID=UPI002E7A3115|nr:helix-turn-helix domain-containing protein [Stenotrophomonas geniculata]
MDGSPIKSPDEILADLGERIKQRRLASGLTQKTLADKAGVSRRAVIELEAGTGSTLQTLARVLKAMDLGDSLSTLVPVPRVSPMSMLREIRFRKRGVR